MAIIFMDVDGVVADLETEWLRRYNRDYDDNLTTDKITGWDLTKFVKPECGEKIFDYLHEKDLYDCVQPIEINVALQSIARLRELGHRVIFATSVPHPLVRNTEKQLGNEGAKLNWLYDYCFLERKHFQKDYIEISDKGLLLGDYLIDDGYHNVKAFKGCSILFTRYHNVQSKWVPRIFSLANLFDGGFLGRFDNQG